MPHGARGGAGVLGASTGADVSGVSPRVPQRLRGHEGGHMHIDPIQYTVKVL